MLLQLTRHILALLFGFLVLATVCAEAQTPVFGNPKIAINQDTLVKNCKLATDSSCFYKLLDVLSSGGDFWTTPFAPYDAATDTGDGYGEGVNGPRSAQRHAFNPRVPDYHFLRLNGLDSQSCFECHNSTGSEVADSRGALIREPYGVAGSAGSNSNAFINPLYPTPQTLFIRQPPAVFGSGYQQAVGDEMTVQLWLERTKARQLAMHSPGPVTIKLVANDISFGTFTTVYKAGSPAAVKTGTACSKVANPTYIGGEAGFSDDVTGVQGVSCDLVVRPLQWKGVASSLRHFVRDALDFHQSMQAFEKVSLCDCDGDGKGTPATGPEVTIGNVTAVTSFVAMTRPPVQLPRVTPSEKLGEKIFFGDPSIPGLSGNMCATCHVRQMTLITPKAIIEWPTNSTNEFGGDIDPLNDATWPIPKLSCPAGKPTATTNCPLEAVFPTSSGEMANLSKNQGALVTPAVSSNALALIHRYNVDIAAYKETPQFAASLNAPTAAAAKGAPTLESAASVTSVSAQDIRALREPLTPTVQLTSSARLPSGKMLGAPANDPLTGTAYVLPLSAPASALSPMQLPRLPANADGTVTVPLLSDLKRHYMGTGLTDPLPPLPPQGTDVENVNNVPGEFLTRPIWGVADTGPWLHDGRALTLRDAILMHGASSTGSEAGPVVDAFVKLSAAQQEAVVDFLLTLRLPPPGGFAANTTIVGKDVSQGIQ